ncbi:MAG: hypothetical protein P1U89_20105 [Verrucomicrobiales bacterium]|nr:hypothetical protein [Verrucomicrobiales bacterium]
MASLFDSQITFIGETPVFLGAFKFVGIGFYLSFVILWLFLQGLVFLAERYSRLISGIQWWRSGLIAIAGILVLVFAWPFPALFSEEETVNVISAMTSVLILGTVVAWIMCGKLYQFEFLHRVIVAVGVPIFSFCAFALGKVIEWKMKGY